MKTKTKSLHPCSMTTKSSITGFSQSTLSIPIGLNGSDNSQFTSTANLVEGNEGNNTNTKDDTLTTCLTQYSKKVFRRKFFYRKFPILNWLQEYNREKFVADFIAGLTVGLTILPQGLAYASLAGVPPQYGLYSGFVGCFVYILFGGSNVITIGPTAIMSIITLSYTSGKPAEYAVMLSFFSGMMMFLMGFFQLGFIVNFISTPVISGFTSAAAITICSTQLKALLGLKFPSEGFLSTVIGTFKHISKLSKNDATLSLVCITCLLLLQKLPAIFKLCMPCLPKKMEKILWLISTCRSVIVIVVSTIVFTWLGCPSQVDVVEDIVPGLPAFKLPQFTLKFISNNTGVEVEDSSLEVLMKQDVSALIVIPLLAIMEHITVAKAFAGSSGVDATQEMISIGLSNIIGSFFSSIPVTGSFSRSTVNAASGSQSPMGGLVTGGLVILALQFLTPYFYFIPKASLAAVIVCAVIVTVDFGIISPMWKSKKMDLLPWILTFAVSLLLGLEYGILTGTVVSVLFLLYYAARPGVKVTRGETSLGAVFIQVDLDRSLVFPSVEYTRHVIIKSGLNWAKGHLPVVIDCHHIQFADFTAAQGIMDLFKTFNERKQKLILWRVKPSIVRIITSVMESNDVDFTHCTSQSELERILEDSSLRATAKKNDTVITFL